MIETTEHLNELLAALSKAQGQIRPALKDRENPHLRSKYADLGSVWEACREVLAEHGLSVQQWPISPEGAPGITLLTILGHSSGQYIRAAYTMPVGKGDAQGYGSALTYARRYALSAVIGIVADDDDDGHAASAPKPAQKPQQTAPRPSAPPAPARDPQAAIGEELGQKLHAQLGALLKGTRHERMTHPAFVETVIGRRVEHLRDLTRAESVSVYNAAKAEQDAAAA